MGGRQGLGISLFKCRLTPPAFSRTLHPSFNLHPASLGSEPLVSQGIKRDSLHRMKGRTWRCACSSHSLPSYLLSSAPVSNPLPVASGASNPWPSSGSWRVYQLASPQYFPTRKPKGLIFLLSVKSFLLPLAAFPLHVLSSGQVSQLHQRQNWALCPCSACTASRRRMEWKYLSSTTL